MKKLGFALVGAASLVIVACSDNNADSLNNVDLNANAGNLDALSNEAANDAEAEALGNQAQQLEQEANTLNNAVDELNAAGDTSVEENVSGM
jgi:hypothetical protein